MLTHARDLLVLFRASFFCPNLAFCCPRHCDKVLTVWNQNLRVTI